MLQALRIKSNHNLTVIVYKQGVDVIFKYANNCDKR